MNSLVTGGSGFLGMRIISELWYVRRYVLLDKKKQVIKTLNDHHIKLINYHL